MLERLRMQEVSQIILSVPEGAIITGTQLTKGEPVIIIDKPSTSTLSFITTDKNNKDEGFISSSGITQSIDFTINDGGILYSVWSYIHGLTEENKNNILKGTEYLHPDNMHRMMLSAHTEVYDLIVYKCEENKKLTKLTLGIDYDIYYEEKGSNRNYYVEVLNNFNSMYFICYNYKVNNVCITNVKQIHNNVFCSLDIYFDAVDIDTDDKHTVCVHCDKVQIFTDLAIGINNSGKVSFTPITVRSIPDGNNLNKNIATITVI